MSQLRQDPITREWVNIAPERNSRPSHFHESKSSGQADDAENCPFCPGHETASEPPLLTLPFNSGAEWRVRVVANKFPAFHGSEPAVRHRHGIYLVSPAVGTQEVVIETPQHNLKPAQLSLADMALVFEAYRSRYRELEKDPRLRYILIFGNHGAEAGASIRHAHSQIIATPILPQYARMKIEGVARYRHEHGRSIYEAMVEQELREAERIVTANASFVAFAPFAARHPFETWILPRESRSHFIDLSLDELEDLAALFKDALMRLDRALGDPPYNFMLLTTELCAGAHWHIEIVPRLSVPAGFELGTRLFINSVAPEDAAARLRAA